MTSSPGKVTGEELKTNLERALERYLLWEPNPDMQIPPGQESPEPNDAYLEDDDVDRMTATEEAKKEKQEFKHEEL